MNVLVLGASDALTAMALERLRVAVNVELFDWGVPAASQFEGVDVVVDMSGGNSTPDMLDVGAAVRLWQIFGDGVERFNVALWRSRGAVVAQCPRQTDALALAEHALMGLLMLVRGYSRARRILLSGELHQPIGRELAGLRLLTVGADEVAQALAIRALALGLEVSAVGEQVTSSWEAATVGHVIPIEHLDDVLPDSDVVSVHIRGEGDGPIIDRRRIELMSKGSYLLSNSAAGLVDEEALTDALRSGHLGGAVLDVFDPEPLAWSSPLMWLPNVIATPHIAAVTGETVARRAAVVLENIERVANDEEPHHRVC